MLGKDEFVPGDKKFYGEDLNLSYSCVEGDCMIRFLSCFKDLKKFTWRFNGWTS